MPENAVSKISGTHKCPFKHDLVWKYLSMLHWLVFSTPLKNTKVNWDDDSQFKWENKKKCSSHHQSVQLRRGGMLSDSEKKYQFQLPDLQWDSPLDPTPGGLGLWYLDLALVPDFVATLRGPRSSEWRHPPKSDGYEWKIPLKWMMTGGTPIVGNIHMYVCIYIYVCMYVRMYVCIFINQPMGIWNIRGSPKCRFHTKSWSNMTWIIWGTMT